MVSCLCCEFVCLSAFSCTCGAYFFTKSTPTFIATSSAAAAWSLLTVAEPTGRPLASQPRNPPDNIATLWDGLALSLYQFAHCGALWTEYWHVKITKSFEEYCFTNAGTFDLKVSLPATAGTWTAPSIIPEAQSSCLRS